MALSGEKTWKNLLCISMEPRERVVDGVRILPWAEFIEALSGGRFDG
jgi:hypothetical protein